MRRRFEYEIRTRTFPASIDAQAEVVVWFNLLGAHGWEIVESHSAISYPSVGGPQETIQLTLKRLIDA